ncbi:GAF and ANTAR domain-containing protein [Pseudokineococcus sp. 1T1Z-3]|uniref:GAF and ANTAR domain-containing protein n=1 Tax=Pseudokineococcus sp. 1T1Z-3 TaxID=3132745 RepID=UPI0030A5E899
MTSHRTRQILATLLDGDPQPGGLPHELAAWSSRSLPVSGAGIVVMVAHQPASTVAATDSVAMGLEDLQFVLGEGPCVESSVSGRSVLVPDLLRVDADRWPAYANGALDLGARALFALPLRVGAIRLGVMDLYRESPGPLLDGDLAEALAFADAATALLLHLQAQAEASTSGDPASPFELHDGRAEIHQATGVIAVQTGLSLAVALVVLRSRAYALDRPVLQVAREVLAGTLNVSRGEP